MFGVGDGRSFVRERRSRPRTEPPPYLRPWSAAFWASERAQKAARLDAMARGDRDAFVAAGRKYPNPEKPLIGKYPFEACAGCGEEYVPGLGGGYPGSGLSICDRCCYESGAATADINREGGYCAGEWSLAKFP